MFRSTLFIRDPGEIHPKTSVSNEFGSISETKMFLEDIVRQAQMQLEDLKLADKIRSEYRYNTTLSKIDNITGLQKVAGGRDKLSLTMAKSLVEVLEKEVGMHLLSQPSHPYFSHKLIPSPR